MRRMKLVKWTEQVQDCLKWKAILEKANTLPEEEEEEKEEEKEEKEKKSSFCFPA
jgi:hypothetical protein